MSIGDFITLCQQREGFHPRHKDHAIASDFVGVPGEYLGCQRGPEVHGRAE